MIRSKLFLFVLLTASVLSAARIGAVKEIFKPKSISVFNKNIYISDQCSVFVYDIDNLKIVNRFIKRGQGPQEFTSAPSIKFIDGKLLVHKCGKQQ